MGGGDVLVTSPPVSTSDFGSIIFPISQLSSLKEIDMYFGKYL